MTAEILAVELGLRGVTEVMNSLEGLAKKFDENSEAITGMAKTLAALAAIVGVFKQGVAEASEWEVMDAKLMGLVNSEKEVAYQMRVIDQIASKGIFSEAEAFEAVHAMDKFGASVRNNIGLVEQLGARGGSIQSAAELIGQIEGGMTFGISRRLRQFGITPDMLKAQGVQFDGRNVTSSPDELIAALKAIEKSDTTLGRLENTLSSTFASLKYNLAEILEMVGVPLLTPLTAALGIFRDMFAWIKDLNAVTDGWLGKFAAGGMLIYGLTKIVGFLKEILILEKLTAVWAGIRSALQVGPAILQGFAKLMTFLRTMFTIETMMVVVETVRAFLAAAIAAAYGNLVPLAIIGMAIGGAVAAGIAVNNYRNSMPGEDSPNSPAKRPNRRDDIERVMKNVYGNAWTG